MNRHRRPVRRSRVPRLATLAAALFASAAVAQSRVAIDIPAEPLDAALNALARRAGVQLVFASALTAGKTAPRVQGRYSIEETLHRLLAQTGLTARRQGDDTFTIEAASSGAEVTLPATVATAAQAESANGPVRGYVARRSATGTKTDAPIEEIPQSISVVTRDRFEAQGAQSVNEALRYTASVSSYGAGTRSDWYTAVRGFVPATYLDGLQLPNTINLASWRVDPWQIERVELLRGPASVLYGQGDPGGTVNIVTKQPTTEPIREIEVQYGSHARKQVAGDFAGALDADGKLSYRLTALARDGNLPLGPFNDQRLMIAPSLTWKPSADTTLTLLASTLRDKTNASDSFLPAQGTILPNPNGKIPATLFTGSPDFDAYEKTQYSLGYQFEHRLNDTWTVRQNARYMHLKLDDRMTYGVGLDPSDPAQRTLLRYAGIAQPSYGRLDIDTQAQARFATGAVRHTLLAGVDYQRQTAKDPEDYALTSSLDLYNPVYRPTDLSIFSGVGASPQDIRQRQTLLGLYLQDQVKLGERWVFTVGGRHDWSETRTDDRLGGTTGSQRDSAFTGRVGVVYLAPYGISPYVSYATSFNPTIGTDRNGQAFRPTKGRQVEAGVKVQAGSKASVTASVFRIHQTNVLTPDLDDPSGTHSAQAGEVRSQGFELEATVQPIAGWNVIAAYTYQDVRNTRANDATLDKWPIAIPTPRQIASLWMDYRIRTGVLQGVGIGAGVRYVSPVAGAPDNALKVPGYALFDAALFYNVGRHWHLALNGTNLANREVISGCYDATRCIYANGRTVLASAKYAW